VAELRSLAADSLDLLKGAVYDERYPTLFDLDVYGSLVGMFELNNLGISILSPLGPWLESLESASGSQDQPSSSSKAESLIGEPPQLSPPLPLLEGRRHGIESRLGPVIYSYTPTFFPP
jgi:hypothetical protein